jgi:hypothetical protein
MFDNVSFLKKVHPSIIANSEPTPSHPFMKNKVVFLMETCHIKDTVILIVQYYTNAKRLSKDAYFYLMNFLYNFDDQMKF